jgi:hypothetical protein
MIGNHIDLLLFCNYVTEYNAVSNFEAAIHLVSVPANIRCSQKQTNAGAT